ncbi:MAG: hypothetical protein EP330_06955 [Deltaproteobacteria bacterium]|nr:MAG: hypothetical protein EP330_06955 [Deltaproteobacteria bacterium]
MSRPSRWLALPLLLAATTAAAQEGPGSSEQLIAPVESRHQAALDQVEPEESLPQELRAIALVQIRGTFTNLFSTNPFVNGQVVGTLGGLNGIVPDANTRSAYVEQRTGAFFTWTPHATDGKAALNAAFEVDFGWGDEAYGTGGNTGGGFGGDQVNLQTRRLHADVYPSLANNHHLHFVAGLQMVADSASDPTHVTPDGLLRSGGRMMFFGSEAAGLTMYGRWTDDSGDRVRYRLGSYTLAENGFSLSDDAWLTMADLMASPSFGIEIGAHLWYLQDRTGGSGGIADLGYGPTSALSGIQGGPARNLYDEGFAPPPQATVDADIVWLGADVGLNAPLTNGPVGGSVALFGTLGRMYAPIAHDDDIRGLLAHGEFRARFAEGKGSVIRVEGLYSSPDNDDIQVHSGTITGNSYGVVGAVHATHGMLLLFPDPGAINRSVAVAYDVSGGMDGLAAVTSGIGYDVVPNKVNVRGSFGTAIAPAAGPLGTEANLRVAYEPLPYLTVYGTGGALIPGSAALVNQTAWVGYAGLDWLVF